MGVAGVTVIVLTEVVREVLLPNEFVTVSVGYHIPFEYVWTGLEFDVLFSQVPSPKLQVHAVISVPEERSVNVTASGAVPLFVLTVKRASGNTRAGITCTKFVFISPSLPARPVTERFTV